MRFGLAVAILAASVAAGAAFTPGATAALWGVPIRSSVVVGKSSTVETADTGSSVEASSPPAESNDVVEEPLSPDVSEASSSGVVPLSSSEVKARLDAQLEKLREKDSSSPKLSKEDIHVVHEDDHIIVVNKPSGLLSVSKDHSNLAQAVCEGFGCEMGAPDRMVVHRLGMATSGLIVFAKTMDAVRGMNTAFRTRKVERKYEALVCGHVDKDEGLVDLPLMRDYEFPPFHRVSTDGHQAALADLDPEQVGKKLLERPKDSLTKYEVVAREDLDGNEVTRVVLTSISGRTHQLNVHMAALGHPIVGDSVYGINGDASANGGLTSAEQDAMVPNPSRASPDLQRQIASLGKAACVHAKSLKFRHPVTNEDVSLSVDAPF